MRTLKIWLLFMVAMVVAIAAHARKDDPDMRHVRLTMTDGKQVEGYIPKKYMTWGLEYQVVLSDKFDAKKGKKYNAEDLDKIEWLALTEEHPEGEVWERCQVIARNAISAVKVERLFELLYRGKNASVYRGHVYLPGNGVNTGASWASWLVLNPNDQDRAFMIYNESNSRMGGLDRQFKGKEELNGLKEYLLAWWQKDKSLARKQVDDSPAIFSHLYDEWKASSGK